MVEPRVRARRWAPRRYPYSQKAIELDPKLAAAYNNVGNVLRVKGQLDEAIAKYQKAIELDPKDATQHTTLGNALRAKGRFDEAIACYKKAVALDPKDAISHTNLGAMLCDVKSDYDGAVACFKKAIEVDPKNAVAHGNLGHALRAKGQVDEAIAAYKEALRIDPKHAAALVSLTRAERLAAVRDKMPAFQNGTYKPASSQERLDLIQWCQIKKLHHTTVGLYGDAFAADPKLADDVGASHRYNAACFAALAAAGEGDDAARLDDVAKAKLRGQALDWLRADLALRAKQLSSGKPTDRAQVQRTLDHWQKDSDLAGIRDAAALAKLPPAEQKAFAQLWADVAALLKTAQGVKTGA